LDIQGELKRYVCVRLKIDFLYKRTASTLVFLAQLVL